MGRWDGLTWAEEGGLGTLVCPPPLKILLARSTAFRSWTAGSCREEGEGLAARVQGRRAGEWEGDNPREAFQTLWNSADLFWVHTVPPGLAWPVPQLPAQCLVHRADQPELSPVML